jgi:predicted esterase
MMARTIPTTTHGRYLVQPASNQESRGLLIGFHGYGELAEAAMDRLRGIPGTGDWTLVAVQALHRFYRGRTREVVASWMTRQDRELAIVDNNRYVSSVVDAVLLESSQESEVGRVSRPGYSGGTLVYTGFSQGVAMAYRAACAAARSVSGVISLGGDIPPELDREALSRIAATLVGRGSRDEWYTAEKMEADLARLSSAAVPVSVVTTDTGHEWTAEFSEAAAAFLKRAGR